MSNEGDMSLSNSPTQPPSQIIPCQDGGPVENHDSEGASSSGSIDVGRDYSELSNDAAASTDVVNSISLDIDVNKRILAFQRRFFTGMATAYHLMKKEFPGLARGTSTRDNQQDELERTLLEEKIKSTKRSIEAKKNDIETLVEQIEAEEEKGRSKLKEEKKKLLDEVRKLFDGVKDVSKSTEAELFNSLRDEVDKYNTFASLFVRRQASHTSVTDESK